MAKGRKTGGGSRKGRPNVISATVRTALVAFVDNNAAGLQELYDRVAADDPAKALEIQARFYEFVLPKLARTETTLDGELSVAPSRLVIKQPPPHG